ncbi:MAG: hypothetical protein IJU72_09695 [Bacteroidales bacterium]|nr:hypothetical protein [Bacteroidales bacterium]
MNLKNIVLIALAATVLLAGCRKKDEVQVESVSAAMAGFWIKSNARYQMIETGGYFYGMRIATTGVVQELKTNLDRHYEWLNAVAVVLSEFSNGRFSGTSDELGQLSGTYTLDTSINYSPQANVLFPMLRMKLTCPPLAKVYIWGGGSDYSFEGAYRQTHNPDGDWPTIRKQAYDSRLVGEWWMENSDDPGFRLNADGTGSYLGTTQSCPWCAVGGKLYMGESMQGYRYRVDGSTLRLIDEWGGERICKKR